MAQPLTGAGLNGGSAVVFRSLPGHERANYGRGAGTDARKVAGSQMLPGKLPGPEDS